MDFDIDDPLAGILSDGSDDSFFNDDILGKKKPGKKKGTPILEKKNALFDLEDEEKNNVITRTTSEKKDTLFDIDTITKKTSSEDFKQISKTPPPLKKNVSKESLVSHSNDLNKGLGNTKKDILDLTKSPNKPRLVNSVGEKLNVIVEQDKKKEATKSLERGKSSQSLLDDILGGSSTKTGGLNQTTRPTTAIKSQEFAMDSIFGKSDSKPVTTFKGKQNIQMEDLKQDVNQPKKETLLKKKRNDDWLGLFQDKSADNDNNEENDEDTGMPSWLSGGEQKQKKSSGKNDVPPIKIATPILQEDSDKRKAKEHVELNLDQMTKDISGINMMEVQPNTSDITADQLYLHQQESQLMIALQLKAQEEKLAAIQERQAETSRMQQEASLAHQAEVEATLRRQAENRRQMQAVIAAHQDRIAERIKALLGPPKAHNENTENENVYETQVDQKESPHVKERNQLLQLVQSLQDNHDKEVDLMETSYRRQLAFLEVSLVQSEERMKEETEKLVRFYKEKNIWLEEHHNMYKKLTEDNLNAVIERHKAENEMLRQQHLDNVRILQEHHAALMENIKTAVQKEKVLIEDSTEFSSNLTHLVADVKESKSQCQLLVEKVQAMTEVTNRDSVKSLQARELLIEDMMQQLKKERDNFETEKNENRDIIKLLENRLKQMTTLIEEETVTLKQKKMEFEFEKATFSKQTEFAKNVLKKQDEEIKTIKDDIQKEYREKIARIDEEKAKVTKDIIAISKEKSAIQNIRQELETMKAEVQAQLEEVNEEKSKLNIEKQQIHMEEQRILAKSRDLDLLAKTATEKQVQADSKYSEAEFIQRKYEDRIRRIQEHVVSLNAREKQIAREKVALSRERLNLHNERKQAEDRQQCSLCKSSQNLPHYTTYDNTYAMPEAYLNVPVSREYGVANVTSPMNAVETEMAQLVGRNLGLRNSVHIRSRNTDNFYEEDLDNIRRESCSPMKDYMDPKLMMLRLDVKQLISNLNMNKGDSENNEENDEDQPKD